MVVADRDTGDSGSNESPVQSEPETAQQDQDIESPLSDESEKAVHPVD